MNGAHAGEEIDKLNAEVKKLKKINRKKIIDYNILTAISPDHLKRDVFDEMRHGWQPQGGVAISGSGSYVQAMVLMG